MGFFNSNFLQHSIKKLIGPINEYGEVTKSIKSHQKEKENNPIYNYIKKKKISRNNLNRGLERPAHKILDEEIEEDTNKWKDIPHL